MGLPPPGLRRDRAIALLLAVVSAAFRLPRLGFPAEEIFDEVYHAKTALEYLQGKNPTEWVHPPTAKLLIAVGVWLFGYESWAWRLMPALAGIALGLWRTPEEFLAGRTFTRFTPGMAQAERLQRSREWQRTVAASLGWARDYAAT